MSEAPGSRRHHRPSLPGAGHFEKTEAGVDPARLSEAAERTARALVRRDRQADPALVDRVVHLAESEGLDTLAELWSGAPPLSLAGALWRLYLLRAWVQADPAGAAREFERGRRLAPVSDAISGVPDPPTPEEVRAMLDAVLAGVVTGDFADTLFRAAAFARVAATGRAGGEAADDRTGEDVGRAAAHREALSAARLLGLADHLHRAGRLELAGELE
ncbi:MAG: hypothetical protein ACTHJH_11415 [Marmoricola sp.]